MPADSDKVDPAAGIFNPRLSDVFGLVIRQDEVDFIVPHLREDLPLYLDPFLLWKSDDPEYRRLHADLLGFVDEVRRHAVDGRAIRASMLLSEVSEPVELGLGYAAGTKLGSALGSGTIDGIVRTFQQVLQFRATRLDHLEVLSLLVPGIAEDRISDLTASVLKRWLSEFTERRCDDWGIPTTRHRLLGWDAAALEWRPFDARLPHNPADGSLLLRPLFGSGHDGRGLAPPPHDGNLPPRRANRPGNDAEPARMPGGRASPGHPPVPAHRAPRSSWHGRMPSCGA